MEGERLKDRFNKDEKKLLSADNISLACSKVMSDFIIEGDDIRVLIYFSAKIIDELFDDKESEA